MSGRTLEEQIQSVLAGLESRYLGVAVVNADTERIDFYHSITEPFSDCDQKLLDRLDWYMVKESKLKKLSIMSQLEIIDVLTSGSKLKKYRESKI